MGHAQVIFFHLDFQDGCSAFFDIYLGSTTQFTFILSSASVVAIVAAEVSKDEKYLAALEVENFGIWAPFTLKLEDATS